MHLTSFRLFKFVHILSIFVSYSNHKFSHVDLSLALFDLHPGSESIRRVLTEISSTRSSPIPRLVVPDLDSPLSDKTYGDYICILGDVHGYTMLYWVDRIMHAKNGFTTPAISYHVIPLSHSQVAQDYL